MTSVRCQHCDRTIGSPAGLIAHIKSMHPEVRDAARGAVGLDTTAPPSPETGVIWEDPPAGRGQHRGIVLEIEQIVDALRAHPGKWARVHEYTAQSGGSTAAKRVRETFDDLEAKGAVVGAGSALFVRYVEEG